MSRQTCQRNLYLSAGIAACAIGLAACSSSSDGDGSGTSPPPPPPPPATGTSFGLGGSGLLGLILGGSVEVQDALTDAVLVTGTTSTADGTYAVSIPAEANFDGSFVRVIVSGGDGALSICDAPSGCGPGVDFGDTFAIDASVSLSALIATPGAGETQTVSVTALTDLADELAQELGGTDGLSPTALAQANTQLADLFGLGTSDLSSIPNIDITDPNATGDDDAIRAALVSAGILEAILEGGDDIASGLSDLADSFVANDGQLVSNEGTDDPSIVSLEDILEAAVEAAEDSPLESDEIDAVQADLTGDLTTTQAEEPDALTDATPSPNAGGSDLDLAMAFVSDLQLIVAAVEQEEEAADLEAFAERVEDAGEALLESEGGEAAINGFVEGVEAVIDAFDAFQSDDTLTSFEADDTFTVTITDNGSDVTLTTTATLPSEALSGGTLVTVTAVADGSFSLEESESFESSDSGFMFLSELDLQADGAFQLSGSSVNEAVRLEVTDGSISVDDLVITDVESGAGFAFDLPGGGLSVGDQDITIAVGPVSIALEAELTDLADEGLSLQGMLTADFLGLSASLTDDFFFLNFEASEALFASANATLDALSLAFSGSVSEGGDSVDLTLALDAVSDSFEFDQALTFFDAITYDVAPDNLSVELVSNVTSGTPPFGLFQASTTYDFELISLSEAEAEVEAANLDIEATTPSGIPVVLSFSEDMLNLVVAPISFNADEPAVARFGGVTTDDQDNAVSSITLYFQSETVTTLLGAVFPSPDFLENPPLDDVVDYWNGAIGFNLAPNVACTGTELSVLLQPIIVPEETPIPALLLESDFPCDFIDPGFAGVFSDAETIDTSAGAALFSASIRQDIVGIDPDDPEVELELFGDVAIDDGDVAGEGTLVLSFAGRRFETDARGFDAFDDIGEDPIEISNQDGVVLTATEDESGDVTGSISVDGVEQATLSESNGVIIATFTDGSFVSIN